LDIPPTKTAVRHIKVRPTKSTVIISTIRQGTDTTPTKQGSVSSHNRQTSVRMSPLSTPSKYDSLRKQHANCDTAQDTRKDLEEINGKTINPEKMFSSAMTITDATDEPEIEVIDVGEKPDTDDINRREKMPSIINAVKTDNEMQEDVGKKWYCFIIIFSICSKRALGNNGKRFSTQG